jgi:hypothetical protein
MKKLFLLLLTTLLVSCYNPYTFNKMGYEVLHEDLESAWRHVAAYSYFMPEDKWQSPREFEAAGGGCCIGFAADLVYHLGPDASFVGCQVSWGDPEYTHAIVKYHGRYLEPQLYGVYYTLGDGSLTEVFSEQSYNSIMSGLTSWGTKSISTRRTE